MDFVLFLILNATLFIRPAEIVPDLIGLPIYNVLILLSLAAAFLKVVGQLTISNIMAEPITAGVLGLLVSIILSHAMLGNLSLLRDSGLEFAKIVLYYLLLVAVIDTPARLRAFLVALVIFIGILTALSLAHYHGFIDVPALDAVPDGEIDSQTGESIILMRLCSTGIFHDPNDLSLILLVGSGVCLFLAGAGPGGFPRPYWLAPVVLFLYALTLTYSKGGFLAMLAGITAFFMARFGAKKAVLLGILCLPVIFLMFAGRQTSISTSQDSGQSRIQLWVEGFTMLRQSPLFGIGYNLYTEYAPQVAHNSYIHAFAELGLLGGCLFLGVFAYAILTLKSVASHREVIKDPDLRRLPAFLLGIVTAYSFGMLTLSRNSVLPTYLILGLTDSYLRMVSQDSPQLKGSEGIINQVSYQLMGKTILISIGFLIAINIFIKFVVRWG